MTRVAVIEVGSDWLVEMMHLPAGTRVVGYKPQEDGVAVMIEHPGLQDVPDQYNPPLITPRLVRDYNTGTIRMQDWGYAQGRRFSWFRNRRSNEQRYTAKEQKEQNEEEITPVEIDA